MNAFPFSTCIFAPWMLLTAPLINPLLLALVLPFAGFPHFPHNPCSVPSALITRFLHAALPSAFLPSVHSIWLISSVHVPTTIISMDGLIGMSLTQTSQLQSSVSCCHGIFIWVSLGTSNTTGPKQKSVVIFPRSVFLWESFYHYQCIQTKIFGGDLTSASPTSN